MIYYPLPLLILAGIRDAPIIWTAEDLSAFWQELVKGNQWGIHLMYAEQAWPEGLTQAFLIGHDFIDNESVCLTLGENVSYGYAISAMLQLVTALQGGGLVSGYRPRDPECYGVFAFHEDCRVGKSSRPRSLYVGTSYYFNDQQVAELALTLHPSSHCEFEIIDLNRHHLVQGEKRLELLGREMAWLDSGTHKSMAKDRYGNHVLRLAEVQAA